MQNEKINLYISHKLSTGEILPGQKLISIKDSQTEEELFQEHYYNSISTRFLEIIKLSMINHNIELIRDIVNRWVNVWLVGRPLEYLVFLTKDDIPDSVIIEPIEGD